MAVTPTTITTEDQIYLTGSPINLRFTNLANGTTIKSVVCELYIWTGNLNAPPSLASYTFPVDKVSSTDKYINIQISEVVASYINGTKFAWTAGDEAPSIAGEGVFFQYKYQITNTSNTETAIESVTNFATRGWRLDYEQVGNVSGASVKQPYLGLVPINYNRNYTEEIKYFRRSFDFAKTLGTCTSENIISSIAYNPTITKCQLGDKYLVVYLNRLGLWDYFTPYGKAVKSIKIDSETTPRLYRDPNGINNNVVHSKQKQIDQTEQSYTLNSGDLHESMTDQIEEVILSPLVYLLEFTGEVFTVVQQGLTVDSTTVTVDSTLYTVDNDTITAEDLGFYSTFRQIPVTCETKTFVKKTRRNDKAKINYDLQFDSTAGRINNLR
jgi:hypothetical protein